MSKLKNWQSDDPFFIWLVKDTGTPLNYIYRKADKAMYYSHVMKANRKML